MAEIRLKQVKKVYEDNVTAVHNFNLDIKDGELVVFVGPSGCGKSTPLRMIAGLEKISEGEIYIDNELVNDRSPKQRNIAMVFQSYALYPHKSVYKNMSFALEIRKLPKAEIDERVRKTAEILGITPYLSRKPRALSGGQRQRVALGRAMVREPSVFLLDEPLSNLDAKLRNIMRTEIKKLHRTLGATFIYVTHDQTEAMTMGDRIVVMKDGVIQQSDTPKNLYDNPCNLFVAGFIGTPRMNFLNALVVKDENSYKLRLYRDTIILPESVTPILLEKYEDKQITLGIRPECLKIYNPLNDDGSPTLSGRVTIKELLGSDMNLHISYGTQEIIANVKAGGEIVEGSGITLTADVEKIRLFDSETGLLIR